MREEPGRRLMPRPRPPRSCTLAGVLLSFVLLPLARADAPPERPPPPPAPRAPGAPLPPPVHRIVGPVTPSITPRVVSGKAGAARRLLPELGIEEDTLSSGVPFAPKERPLFGPEAAGRQRIKIHTEDVGRLTVEAVDEHTLVAILAGNPSIRSDELSVKARVLVVWLDREKASALAAFTEATPEGATPGATGAAAPKAPVSPPGNTRAKAAEKPAASASAAKSGVPAFGNGDLSSVVPEAVLGIYAVGSVDLVTPDQAFRGDELYVDPRTNQALLIQPRFDTSIQIQQGTENERKVPIYVRADRARILARGLATFDDASVTTSRASDRIEFRVHVLTVEEYGKAQAGDPTFLGFTNKGTQRFFGQGIQARGERIPLFYAPSAEFGGEKGLGDYPVKIRGADFGNRSSLGYYAFLSVGGTSAGTDPWLDWTLTPGGYTKRGPAGLLDLKFKPGPDEGRVKGFYLYDRTGEDRDGYEAGVGGRGFVEFENRWALGPKWRLDAEANWFSDQNVNREFFEYDALNHKDRETYVRPRYLDGGLAATLTLGYHLRDFVTETVQQPEVEIWSESVPLGTVGGRLPLDLSSQLAGGWLRRQVPVDTSPPEYTAYRMVAYERLYAPFQLGDVKISPFVGGDLRGYYDRTDGGADVTDGALTAGITADVQFHRDFAAYGGPWGLDGLRHTIDVDVSGYGRWLSSVTPEDVPQFDRIDQDQDRTEVVLDLTQRLETRRAVGPVRRNALVAALRTRLSWWPDRIGPYERTGLGSLEWWGGSEVVPSKAWIVTEGLSQFDPNVLWRASLGGVYAPSEELSLGLGVRGVKESVLAPWFNVYYKWNEKWAVRGSGIDDFQHDGQSSYRLSLLRFSDDHMWEFGIGSTDRGSDVTWYVNFTPSIGGVPTTPVFSPREAVDVNP